MGGGGGGGQIEHPRLGCGQVLESMGVSGIPVMMLLCYFSFPTFGFNNRQLYFPRFPLQLREEAAGFETEFCSSLRMGLFYSLSFSVLFSQPLTHQ